MMLLEKTNPRIGELDYDVAIAKIAEVMELVYGVMGFREDLNDAQGGKILQFIYFNYKELHPVELEIAFDLTAKGAIKAELAKGYNIRYLAHVLNSYVQYRKKLAHPKLEHQQAKAEVHREKEAMKPEDYKKMHEENCNTIQGLYDKFLKDPTAPYSDYRSSFTYGYLIKRGILIPASFEAKDVYTRAIDILKNRRSKTGIALAFDDKDINATKMDVVVADLFKRWQELDIKPFEYLTKELK